MERNKKVESYQRELQLSTNSDYLNYLTTARGLSTRTIEDFHLGLDKKKNITIPIYDNARKFVGFRYRANPLLENPKSKYWSDEGLGNTLFYSRNIQNKPEFVVVTEGEFDCMSLQQFDIPAISQTTGAGLGKNIIDKIGNTIGTKKIVFAFDNDTAGKKAMYQIAKHHRQHPQYELLFCELDEVKDWNELVVKRLSEGADNAAINDELQARLSTAFTAEDYVEMSYREFEPNYLRTIRASEVPDEDVQFLIKPLIVSNGVNLITAAPKAMKTMLILHMLIAAMDNKPFVDYFETSQIDKVLLIDQESLKSEVRKRIERFDGDTHRFLLTADEVYFDKMPELKDQIKKLIDLEGIDVVVIDTMRRVNADMEENSSKDVAKFFAAVRSISAKATVIVVHHETKGSMGYKSTYRGSGDILGSVDSHIYVQKTDKFENGAKIKIVHENARYSGNHEDVEVEFISEDGLYRFEYLGKVAANKAEQLEAQRQEFLAELENFILEGEQDGRNTKEIEVFCKETFDWGQHRAKELREELVDSKVVQSIKNYEGGRATHYIHKEFAAQQLNTI